MSKKIVISNLMRAKNKQSFFALHQIQSKILALYPDIDLHFHILWDSYDNEMNYQEEEPWSNLIDSEIKNVHSYSKSFFNNYVKHFYNLDYEQKFSKFKAIYHVLMAHYLRRVKLEDYYLIYDDDILINDDFKHITDLMLERIPVGLTEPTNFGCDKVLLTKLLNLFGKDFQTIYLARNPKAYGFNAGFQGIDLSIYDNFLSADRFKVLLDLFEYSGVFDEDGKEIWGQKRFEIDTQQQSFFGLMNTVLSKKPIHILDPEEYYVIPNFGYHPKFGNLDPSDKPDEGWRAAFASRITHFIGHTQGRGKPKPFLERVEDYLKQKNYL